jgi:hypothetical protein
MDLISRSLGFCVEMAVLRIGYLVWHPRASTITLSVFKPNSQNAWVVSSPIKAIDNKTSQKKWCSQRISEVDELWDINFVYSQKFDCSTAHKFYQHDCLNDGDAEKVVLTCCEHWQDNATIATKKSSKHWRRTDGWCHKSLVESSPADKDNLFTLAFTSLRVQ